MQVGNSIRVGNLSYNPEKIVGEGSYGTIVNEGTFHKSSIKEENMKVAIKRILKMRGVDDELDVLREVDLMKKAEGHPNILHVITTEEDAIFL